MKNLLERLQPRCACPDPRNKGIATEVAPTNRQVVAFPQTTLKSIARERAPTTTAIDASALGASHNQPSLLRIMQYNMTMHVSIP
jgi:hypothetical protein